MSVKARMRKCGTCGEKHDRNEPQTEMTAVVEFVFDTEVDCVETDVQNLSGMTGELVQVSDPSDDNLFYGTVVSVSKKSVRSDGAKLAYVLGMLEGTTTSVCAYSAEALIDRMKLMAAYIQDDEQGQKKYGHLCDKERQALEE